MNPPNRRIMLGPQRPLTIQEVSKKVNVAKPTLRFWERKLPGVIVPLRTHGGQRRYTREHILVIEEIKKLKQDGLNLMEIKRELTNGTENPGEFSNAETIDILANQIAQMVKAKICRFLQENDQT